MDARAFTGFDLAKTCDHFSPLNGMGPPLVVECRDLPEGGVEQTLLLDALKLSVAEQPPLAPRAQGLPEVHVAVSRRKHATAVFTAATFEPMGDAHYELIFASRTVLRDRATSVEQLADTFDAPRHGKVEHGNLESVVHLIDGAASAYGTTAEGLVEAVGRIAPPQLAVALSKLI